MTARYNHEAVAYLEALIANIDTDYFSRLSGKLEETYDRYFTEMVRTVEQASTKLPQCAITLRPLVEEYTIILCFVRDNATLPRNLSDQQAETSYLTAIRALNCDIRKRLEGHLSDDDLDEIDAETERWLAHQAASHNQLYDLVAQTHTLLMLILQDTLLDVSNDATITYAIDDVIRHLQEKGISITTA